MDSIATRNQKILLTDVVDAVTSITVSTSSDPCFFCFTCLSREKENELHNDGNSINTTLKKITSHVKKTHECVVGYSENSKDISFSCLNTKGHIVTLGTYDNIPLTTNDFNDHYFIKENDLKYASFNVANKFGVYAPLLNYTKDQQDMFNSRGYDEDIISSVTLAYENGVQFVCIPPTKDRGNIKGSANESDAYDYPTTVEKCKTYFTDATSGNVLPYKKRVSSFVSAIEDIVNTQTENETRINNIEANYVPTSDFSDLSNNLDVLDSDLDLLSSSFEDADFATLRSDLDYHLEDNTRHLSRNQRRKIRRSRF